MVLSCFRKGFLNGKPFLFFSAGSAANSTFTFSISDHNALTLSHGQTLPFEYNESFIHDDMKKQLDDVADLFKKDRNI
ncbi:hypothetical protein BH11BAC7_BH11BAC7_35130 [soil metagenome]